MAQQWVLQLAESTYDLVNGAFVAASTSNACYIVTNSSSDSTSPLVLKVDTDGAIVWRKKILPAGGDTYGATFSVATAGTGNVAVVAHKSAATAGAEVFVLDATTGAIVWQKSLPAVLIDTYRNRQFGRCAAMDSSGNVFVVGRKSDNTKQHVFKLAAADGAISWQVDILDDATTSSDQPAQIATTSTGDLAITLTASDIPVLHLLTAAAGAISWTRKLTLTTTNRETVVAVDQSTDAIYVATNSVTAGRLSVVKFTSAGGTTWNNDIVLSSPITAVLLAGGAVANAAGVYIGADLTAAAGFGPAGVVFLDAAGTAASAAGFDGPNIFAGDGPYDIALGNGKAFISAYQIVGADYRADIWKFDTVTGFTDADYGSTFDRWGYAATVTTGTPTVTTPSLTHTDTSSVSPATPTATLGTDALTLTLHEVVPPVSNLKYASSVAPSATFGTPRDSRSFPPAPWVPSTTFGTAALDYNLENSAAGFSSTLFGLPYVVQYEETLVRLFATQIAPATAVGTPTATATISAVASSVAPATTFGAPRASTGGAASGFLSSTFGTPQALLGGARRATGFSSTLFGTPSSAGIHAALAIAPTVRFGVVSARRNRASVASGFTSTAFGTPSVRARHLVGPYSVSTRFGTPIVERVCT